MSLNESDVRIDVYTNAAGSTAVVTHRPTGIKAVCSDFATEFQNRRHAIDRLAEKIAERS